MYVSTVHKSNPIRYVTGVPRAKQETGAFEWLHKFWPPKVMSTPLQPSVAPGQLKFADVVYLKVFCIWLNKIRIWCPMGVELPGFRVERVLLVSALLGRGCCFIICVVWAQCTVDDKEYGTSSGYLSSTGYVHRNVRIFTARLEF